MNTNKLVKAATKVEIIVHWALAGSLIILFVTGSALAFKFLNFIQILFAGPYIMKSIHHIVGLIFFISVIFVFFMWLKDCLFEADDLKWIVKAGGYIIRTHDLPKLAKFNPGQKIFFWYTVFFGLLASFTGYLMLYPANYNSTLVQWSYPLHVLAYAMFGIGWLGHWYLGTAANPGSLCALTTGWAPKSWVLHHRGKWPIKHTKVVLYGNLNSEVLKGLQEKLEDFFTISWEDIILDFHEVTDIDDVALDYLKKFIENAKKKGRVIIEKAKNPNIVNIIQKVT